MIEKNWGYKALKDTNCGMKIKLVPITESTVLLIRSKVNHKTKRVILVISFINIVLFSNLESFGAIGLSMPPTPLVRVQPSYHKNDPIVYKRLDKIYFMSNREIIPLIYLNAKNVYITEKVLKKLRTGNLSGNLVLVTVGIVVYIICQLSSVDAFAIFDQIGKRNAPTFDSRFGLNPTYRKTPSRPRTGSALEITRPTAMPHPEFVGLTKEHKRQVHHHHDRIIHVEGHPQLRIGFWQCRFKVLKHGAIHGLPYNRKENGSTRTEKSDDNALVMIQSIEDMPHRPNAVWFDQDDVTYQGGTDRGFPAVYIFDEDTKIAAVFNKQTENFVTTCQLTRHQET
jgi:hypothetical protein